MASERSLVMPTLEKVWTEAELLALPREKGSHELVDGELINMPPAGGEHGDVGGELCARLRVFTSTNKLGRTFNAQTGYWMKSGNMRAPDISFVSAARLKELGEIPKGLFPFAPDFAIEVLSPSDRKVHLERKLADYFESGTKMVWFVKPKTRSVSVYRDALNPRILRGDDVLSGEDVVPGFELRVSELFEGI